MWPFHPIHQVPWQSDNRKLNWPRMTLMTSMWPWEANVIPSTRFHGNPTTGSLLTLYEPNDLNVTFRSYCDSSFSWQSNNRKFIWPCMTMMTSIWRREIIAIPSTKFHGNWTTGNYLTLYDPAALHLTLKVIVIPSNQVPLQSIAFQSGYT
jgi:hypothetical protein